jgi:LPS export ABC transporter protein LptC
MGEEAKNVTSYFSQMGIMKAKLTAPLLLRFQTDTIYTEFPKSLHVDFYDANVKMESQLDALYGKYFENLNKVFLRDSVVVMNIKGDTLRCPELWWDQQTKTFFTDKIVRIHTKDKHIYGGRGLEADQAFSWYIIKEPTGTILVSDSLQ